MSRRNPVVYNNITSGKKQKEKKNGKTGDVRGTLGKVFGINL